MNVASSIKKFGVSRVARASGYPISTIHRWFRQNRVPGNGKAKEVRERELLAAFQVLKGERNAAR